MTAGNVLSTVIPQPSTILNRVVDSEQMTDDGRKRTVDCHPSTVNDIKLA